MHHLDVLQILFPIAAKFVENQNIAAKNAAIESKDPITYRSIKLPRGVRVGVSVVVMSFILSKLSSSGTFFTTNSQVSELRALMSL